MKKYRKRRYVGSATLRPSFFRSLFPLPYSREGGMGEKSHRQGFVHGCNQLVLDEIIVRVYHLARRILIVPGYDLLCSLLERNGRFEFWYQGSDLAIVKDNAVGLVH